MVDYLRTSITLGGQVLFLKILLLTISWKIR
jgi:hypothetical protein